jgi:hypothetical protein
MKLVFVVQGRSELFLDTSPQHHLDFDLTSIAYRRDHHQHNEEDIDQGYGDR